MKRVLYVLGQLRDLDIEWMIDNGFKRHTKANEYLIKQGVDIDHLFIILSGNFSVEMEDEENTTVAQIGTGEIVGEMSFLDRRPPSTSVVSINTAKVFAIPVSLIKEKVAKDREFAARLYYSLALFLSSRMRITTGKLGYGVPQDVLDEIDDNVMDNIAGAGARFKKILNRFSEV